MGAAKEYRNEDEGWGIPVARAIAGDPDLPWRINALAADEFDITMCRDMLVDHAVTIPMALMWPGVTGRVAEVRRNYHIPISNTAAATVVLPNHTAAVRQAA